MRKFCASTAEIIKSAQKQREKISHAIVCILGARCINGEFYDEISGYGSCHMVILSSFEELMTILNYVQSADDWFLGRVTHNYFFNAYP